jgi:hypothetical protein
MENGERMRLILSRKGFDSSSGRTPSPIFPDGRMVSLPIPDKQSPIRYQDINWHEFNLGSLVSDLTGGKIPASDYAHLDPDLYRGSFPRDHCWKPLFGQTGAAQGHLRKSGVQEGDVFLFFGLFRPVIFKLGRLDWDKASHPRHVVWGWLQIGEIFQVDTGDMTRYKWAEYHPHFHQGSDRNNTVYVSRNNLNLPGGDRKELAGAGVFPHFSEELQLTAPSAKTPSLWELPTLFYPSNSRPPLTYHGDLTRWQRTNRGTLLNTVARGQEFVLDCGEYPEAIEWLNGLLKAL